MKVIGTKTISLSKLTLEGDFKQAMDSPITKDIVNSYGHIGGHIQDPVVRLIDDMYHLVTGRKRTAAHLRLKHKQMEVKLIECSDAEAEDIMDIENACRRHDPEFQIGLLVKLVDKYEAEIEVERAFEPDKTERKPGRPVTPRGEARKRAADATGIKPESVRQAEERLKKTELEAEQKAAEPPVKLLGMEIGDSFLDDCAAIKKYIGSAASRVQFALGDLKQLESAEFVMPTGTMQKARALAAELGTLLRTTMMPLTLCPFCKGLGEYQDTCTGCESRGWMGKLDKESIAPELLQDAGYVMYQGELLSVGEIIGEQPITELEEEDPPAEYEEQDLEEDIPW